MTAMVCATCGAPVFQGESGGWLHDIRPRHLATPARKVTAAVPRKRVKEVKLPEPDWEEKEIS